MAMKVLVSSKQRTLWVTLLFLAAIGLGIYLFINPPIPRMEQVHLARRRWDSLEIKNYHIVIKFYENFANGIETQRDVIVKNGQVVSSSCASNQCPTFVLAKVYTVDDLFSIAQGSTIADIGEEYNYCVQGLEFDWLYGFPKSMNVDCPRDADEEHSFQVISFEPLK